ncbi:acetyl-CoA C-acyltransferase, partial [Pseudoalteromonas sp. S558]
LSSNLGFIHVPTVPPEDAEDSTRQSMGQTAEQMAKTHNISREDQDALAHRSHSLATQAWADGKLKDEVMTAPLPPYKSFIEEANNNRKNSRVEGYARS